MADDQSDSGQLTPPEDDPRPIRVRPPGPRPLSPPRLSVVEMAYHQHSGESPTGLLDGEGVRYEVDLASDEQPYVRRMLATEKWQRLDVGWIKGGASVLLLRNDEGRFDFNPDEEHLAKAMSRVIELSLRDDLRADVEVPPHQTCRFRPVSLGMIFVRCARETARFTLCLAPR